MSNCEAVKGLILSEEMESTNEYIKGTKVGYRPKAMEEAKPSRGW